MLQRTSDTRTNGERTFVERTIDVVPTRHVYPVYKGTTYPIHYYKPQKVGIAYYSKNCIKIEYSGIEGKNTVKTFST